MLRRLLIAFLMVALASVAFGQKKAKTPTEKSISGVVTDAGGNAVPGAVVQLKNMKTLQVRSFIAKEMGDYVFMGLPLDADYEVKAEFKGLTSATKTLSSFDSRTEAKINLQIK
jgi:hypothetical protein